MKKQTIYETILFAVIMIVASLLLFGCTTTKQLSRSSEIVAIESNYLAHQSDSVATLKKEETTQTLVNIDVSEALEYEIKEYDTDKPIDRITGKPPLKKEITARNKKRTSAQNKQAARTIQSDSIATSKTETIKHKKEIQHKGREDIEQKTKFIFPWWGILGGSAVALLIIGIIKLWKSKFWKRL